MRIVYDFWPFCGTDQGYYALTIFNGHFRYPSIDFIRCNDSVWIVPGTITD